MPETDRTAAGLGPPTREQLVQYAAELGVSVSGVDLDACAAGVAATLGVLARLEALEVPRGVPRYSERDAGCSPNAFEDPCNAIVRFCEVNGAAAGSLAGVRIGIKDNIAVAGVPLAYGEIDDAAPVPAEDAVVVERLLDAGAHIIAKTTVGSLAGETRNPRDLRFSPGFSSSGSGAAVAVGLVDAALGTDQSGSVRIPAAWCGVVGMKATRGLVPTSYGVGDHRLNEIGPLTTTVASNVAMLEAMMGRAGVADAAQHGVDGLRVGVVAESAESSQCTPRTLHAFGRATQALLALGVELVPVSVPAWSKAATVLLATVNLWHVAAASHWLGNDCDYEGRIDERLLTDVTTYRHDALERSLALLLGEHLRRHGEGGEQLARAYNLCVELRGEVDRVLADVDLLVTPTTPAGPYLLTDKRLARVETVMQLLRHLIRNTAPCSLTGHPALSVPSGPGDDDLPTGLQIIGRRFDEYTVYRAGFAFERLAVTLGPGGTGGAAES